MIITFVVHAGTSIFKKSVDVAKYKKHIQTVYNSIP